MKIGCVQLNVQGDIDQNLMQAGELIREAAKEECEFIATPENTDFMGASANETYATACTASTHPGIPFFAALAREFKVWILVGSMKIKNEETRKLFNRSFLFNKSGQLVASYDKIHLFDVDLPQGESHRESDNFAAGESAVIANTQWEKLGMSICYDVRFPHLYRSLAQNGAKILSVPSAFTVQTGKAHWVSLLCARAIETGSFVIAPAQGGQHPGGRETYGHSMIVDPWGKVLAEKADNKPGIITRTIDFVEVTRARHAIPSLQHDRNFSVKVSKDYMK